MVPVKLLRSALGGSQHRCASYCSSCNARSAQGQGRTFLRCALKATSPCGAVSLLALPNCRGGGLYPPQQSMQIATHRKHMVRPNFGAEHLHQLQAGWRYVRSSCLCLFGRGVVQPIETAPRTHRPKPRFIPEAASSSRSTEDSRGLGILAEYHILSRA